MANTTVDLGKGYQAELLYYMGSVILTFYGKPAQLTEISFESIAKINQAIEKLEKEKK